MVNLNKYPHGQEGFTSALEIKESGAVPALLLKMLPFIVSFAAGVSLLAYVQWRLRGSLRKEIHEVRLAKGDVSTDTTIIATDIEMAHIIVASSENIGDYTLLDEPVDRLIDFLNFLKRPTEVYNYALICDKKILVDLKATPPWRWLGLSVDTYVRNSWHSNGRMPFFVWSNIKYSNSLKRYDIDLMRSWKAHDREWSGVTIATAIANLQSFYLRCRPTQDELAVALLERSEKLYDVMRKKSFDLLWQGFVFSNKVSRIDYARDLCSSLRLNECSYWVTSFLCALSSVFQHLDSNVIPVKCAEGYLAGIGTDVNPILNTPTLYMDKMDLIRFGLFNSQDCINLLNRVFNLLLAFTSFYYATCRGDRLMWAFSAQRIEEAFEDLAFNDFEFLKHFDTVDVGALRQFARHKPGAAYFIFEIEVVLKEVYLWLK